MKSFYQKFGAWGRTSQWWLAFCSGGAAGLVPVGDAGAAIVYSGEKNIGITSDFNGVFISVTAQQSSTPANGLWDLNPFFGGLGIANSPGFQPVRSGAGNEAPILALTFGASVGGSLTYSSGSGGSGAEDDSGHLGAGAGQFTDGQTGYLGFKLLSGTDVSYGWMRVNLTSNGETGSVIDWAYDNSGSPILTGAVTDLGAAPIVRQAGTEQTLSASQAGTGLLMEEGAKIIFDEGTSGGSYTGNIQGAGEIRVAGAGGLRLSGVNLFSGSISVLEGSRLTVGGAGNLGSAQIRIGSSGSLEFASLAANNGSANTFANAISLGGQSGTFNNTGSGKVVLSGPIASNGGLLVFTGGSFDVLGGISEAGSLIKEGTGTLTLSGNNSYTGATTVTAGQLTVNGDSSGSVHTVESGAVLGGSGTVGALVVQSGGTIAPGNSPGTLSVSGYTIWEVGGNYNWQLLDAMSVAGIGWDTVAINGVLDLSALSAGDFNLNLWSISSFGASTGDALNFDGNLDYSWTIATALGGITGFRAGHFSIFTGAMNGTNGFSNDYTDGTFSLEVNGNNLNLVYDGLSLSGPSPVPEPASTFTVLALFSSGLLHRRKRAVRH
jgi:autotransporter-associated beta strand protein